MYILLMIFFFNDTATTEIYTLSLHDALPICGADGRGLPEGSDAGSTGLRRAGGQRVLPGIPRGRPYGMGVVQDRKSTRLNSSHGYISYAVFCLKKKKKYNYNIII